MKLKDYLTPENLEKIQEYETDEVAWYCIRSLDRNNPKAKWIVWGSLEYELCDISDDDRIDKDLLLERAIRWLLVEDNQHMDICVFHEINSQDYEYVRVHYGAIQWLKQYYFNYKNGNLSDKNIKEIKKKGALFIDGTYYFATPPIGTAKELNDWFVFLGSFDRTIQIYNGEYLILTLF